MAGIREVAKKANVSISTVSLVLNNNGYVSPETRENVMKAVKELEYVPNELARNLFRNRTNIVGVILPDILHPFFGAFAKFAEMELYKNGNNTMLCSTVGDENGEKEYIDMLKRQMMDGIIMGTHTIDTRDYDGLDKPVVSLDRYINEKIPIVRSDHVMGGHLAAEEFIRAGCKAVLQVVGDSRVKTPAHKYHNSLREMLEKNGVKVYQNQLPWNQWDFECFEKQVQNGFRKNPDLDGVYGADQTAVAALKEAFKRKKKVPQDLKIVAYDGTVVTRMTPLEITCIQQNVEELARLSVELLLKQIQGEKIEKQEYILDVKLIKRDTT